MARRSARPHGRAGRPSVVLAAGVLLVGAAAALVVATRSGAGAIEPVVAADPAAGRATVPTLLEPEVEEVPRLTASERDARPLAEDEAPIPAPPPPPTEGQLWSEIWGSASALMHGEMTRAQALALWGGLLSRLDDAERVEHETGFVTYELLPRAGFGTATLTLRPEGHTRAPLSIDVVLETPPGHFTGFAEDAASHARMELSAGLDEAGDVAFLNHLVQLEYHQTQGLREQLVDRGHAEIPTGGCFTLRPDGATWFGVTAGPLPSGPDEPPVWNNAMGERIARDGALPAAGPVVGRLGDVLRSLKP